MSFDISRNGIPEICFSEKESDAVKLAAENLKNDLTAVFGNGDSSEAKIYIETYGISDRYSVCFDALFKDGKPIKEAYLHIVEDGNLIILGTDRRGTIYGIYALSKIIGVSPWHFFADVPVKHKESFSLSEGYEYSDYPTVEYRGIFINDEEELNRWAQLYMGEDTIGVKTYEKVFELLLRLGANYIWPAMHVNSFNVRPENGALANRMGIVVGTSHCDMLMRSNNREWKPWLQSKGYTDVKYDYSIEGENRDKLKEYWSESVEQNKDFEVSYTLGMRGIHDSGFDTSAFSGLKGEELKKAKIGLLERIIADQNEIIRNIVGHDTLKTFVPYKEVLPLYDAGLNIPDDLTLIWSNDNYGYIRRYPNENEKKRAGGNGIYYHNSYWSPPGAMSYLFICSQPLAHTKNELKKAYAEGIRKLWVLNVGALKPLEISMEFFLRYAWEIGKEKDTADTDIFVERWIDSNYSGNAGKECAEIFNSFDALTNMRKVEQLDNSAFSCDAYGDEWSRRMNRCRELYKVANSVYERIPDDEKDSFYQTFLMKIHAGYIMNFQYYYADRSIMCHNSGRYAEARLYSDYYKKCDDEKRALIEYYNHGISGGKWNGILMPETFPPPAGAMHPIYMPPLKEHEKKAVVTLFNNDGELKFVKPSVKYIDISNCGEGALEFKITAPPEIRLSQTRGKAEPVERVMIEPGAGVSDFNGEIVIETECGKFNVPVSVCYADTDCPNIEDEGIIVVRADSAHDADGWSIISRLGRGRGGMAEAEKAGAVSEYEIFLCDDCEKPLLEIFRFPSLNSVGRIRVGVSVDGGEVFVIESESRDEHLGNWEQNVRDNADKLYFELPKLTRGLHRIGFVAIDKYFAFSLFAVYTKPMKKNNTAADNIAGDTIPTFEHWGRYSKINKPRPTVYADINVNPDNCAATDIVVESESYGREKAYADIIASGETEFSEADGDIRIDALSALAMTDNAYVEGEWLHCGSESYGRSSAALFNPKRGENAETSLNYKFNCSGGDYTIWILVKIPNKGKVLAGLSVDGAALPKERLYNGGNLWRYEAEQLWRWVPFAGVSLTEGGHELGIMPETEKIRFDRIYIAKKSALPPTDGTWEK